MNHIAVYLIGIIAFMMINSSRQMDKQRQVSKGKQRQGPKDECIKTVTKFKDKLKEYQLEILVRTRRLLVKTYPQESHYLLEKSVLPPSHGRAAHAACLWLELKLDNGDVTLKDKCRYIEMLELILDFSDPPHPTGEPSTSSSVETSTSTKPPTELELIVKWLNQEYNSIAKEYNASFGNEIPIEQGQHTTLPQPSDGKRTAARSERANISSTNEGKNLREKPFTKAGGDEDQDDLPSPSKRSDGPSATGSKNNKSSKKKERGKKK